MRHKHYPKSIIDGFRKDILTTEDPRFEDYPSETTISRWKKCLTPDELSLNH